MSLLARDFAPLITARRLHGVVMSAVCGAGGERVTFLAPPGLPLAHGLHAPLAPLPTETSDQRPETSS